MTKGKSYIYTEQFQDEDEDEIKEVYIVTFQDGNVMRDKIRRLCESFTGKIFDLPSAADLNLQMERMKNTIKDNKAVYENTRELLRQQLMEFDTIQGDAVDSNTSSTIYVYKMFLAKEKALYQTLNLMKAQNQSFIGYFWAPQQEQDKIQAQMANQTATKIVAFDNHCIGPPTYFPITDLTRIFQMIVDTYGIPTYKEASPVLVSMITFPFMFGMMFGDMGHGSIIFSFGLFLTLGANKLRDTVFAPALMGRYMLLMMGFCSVYCGFIYNEFFALKLNLFDSCYNLDTRVQQFTNVTAPDVPVAYGDYTYERLSYDCNYPFGVDPVWALSTNNLTFTNNIKMKMAVIFGVLHMVIGILIKGTNTIYFRQWAAFFTEVIGGLMILLFLIGFMDVLIFLKWFKTLDIDAPDGAYQNGRMPSVLNIMIGIVFGGGAPPPGTDQTSFLGSQNMMYKTGLVLLGIVVIMVPIYLCVRPCCFRHTAKVEEATEIEFSRIEQNEPLMHSIQNERNASSVGEGSRGVKSIDQIIAGMGTPDHSHSFGEAFIHQMIETIEFVLGTVSNTASYLRLWALSLAHSQLSEVFFNLIFKIAMGQEGIKLVLFSVVLWPCFMTVTTGVLLFMDLLECFLHTLRLHWVEFQNKFYKADGFKFSPLSFRKILLDAEY